MVIIIFNGVPHIILCVVDICDIHWVMSTIRYFSLDKEGWESVIIRGFVPRFNLERSHSTDDFFLNLCSRKSI